MQKNSNNIYYFTREGKEIVITNRDEGIYSGEQVRREGLIRKNIPNKPNSIIVGFFDNNGIYGEIEIDILNSFYGIDYNFNSYVKFTSRQDYVSKVLDILFSTSFILQTGGVGASAKISGSLVGANSKKVLNLFNENFFYNGAEIISTSSDHTGIEFNNNYYGTVMFQLNLRKPGTFTGGQILHVRPRVSRSSGYVYIPNAESTDFWPALNIGSGNDSSTAVLFPFLQGDKLELEADLTGSSITIRGGTFGLNPAEGAKGDVGNSGVRGKDGLSGGGLLTASIDTGSNIFTISDGQTSSSADISYITGSTGGKALELITYDNSIQSGKVVMSLDTSSATKNVITLGSAQSMGIPTFEETTVNRDFFDNESYLRNFSLNTTLNNDTLTLATIALNTSVIATSTAILPLTVTATQSGNKSLTAVISGSSNAGVVITRTSSFTSTPIKSAPIKPILNVSYSVNGKVSGNEVQLGATGSTVNSISGGSNNRWTRVDRIDASTTITETNTFNTTGLFTYNGIAGSNNSTPNQTTTIPTTRGVWVQTGASPSLITTEAQAQALVATPGRIITTDDRTPLNKKYSISVTPNDYAYIIMPANIVITTVIEGGLTLDSSSYNITTAGAYKILRLVDTSTITGPITLKVE